MMTKRTNANATDRIQLSNQRDSRDCCFRDSGGRSVTGVAFSPEPFRVAPKSCMPLTLANGPAGRNGHRPPPRPPPPPDPGGEFPGGLLVTDARGETRRAPLAL